MRLILVLAVLVFAASASAEPFLVADPQPAAWFAMRLSADNGATWSAWTEGPPVSGALRFDLGSVPPGQYKGQARAGGNVEVTDDTTGVKSVVWRWSDPSPFSLSVSTGVPPKNLKGVEK
jgi:hypothetical protein